jgi:16S rRNA (cytosine967-C5)-methyltransferase
VRVNSARALALRALRQWRGGGREFADQILHRLLANTSLGKADRAFAQELFYAVLRNLSLLDFWIAQLRSPKIEPAARDLLRLGLCQIMLLETSPHAAVFETVQLAPSRLRKLINAVLRRAVRETAQLREAARREPPHIQWSEPAFLLEKWTRQFGPEAALELAAWNNRPAPVYARINQLKMSLPDFLARYSVAAPLPSRENFVSFSGATNAIENGDCYAQDPSTGMACELLNPGPGEIVLDACAAPGGKTAWLAEIMSNRGMLVATDREEERLARLSANLVRLGVANTQVIRCDWRDPSSIAAAGLAAASFDKILLDAPCTNTGVMRRRVDARWRLRPDDFARMAAEQLEILRAITAFLRPGGALVYSTCSLEPEENRDVVENFLREQKHFRLALERQSLPFRDHFDGAYAALLSTS